MSSDAELCAAEVVFRMVRGRWALKLIAAIAAHEPIQFLSLGRSVPGISSKVLAEQLRFFLQAGVIKQTRTAERQEVLYQLTNRGRELKKAIDGLNDFAARWPTL